MGVSEKLRSDSDIFSGGARHLEDIIYAKFYSDTSLVLDLYIVKGKTQMEF